MANRVFIDKTDVIRIVTVGSQTYESVKQIERDVRVISDKLRAQGKPVKILDDLTLMTSQNMGARKAALELMSLLPTGKIAIFGSSRIVRHVANLIITASGKTNSVKQFETEELALKWLNE